MIKEFIAKHKTDAWILFYFGVITFIYSLCASSFIQLYAIQIMFPQFNLGEGIAVFDSAGFNLIAKKKAMEINGGGWQFWELRPSGTLNGYVTAGQSPAGIASIFYTLWEPKPYVMLPFNAIVNALSGCLVVWLLRCFYSLMPSIMGGALFIMNPMAMEWVSQIHRDGIFILGNLMVLVSLFHLLKILNNVKVNNMLWATILGLSGTSLTWVARPYWVQVLFVTILLWLFALVILCAFTGKCSNEK